MNQNFNLFAEALVFVHGCGAESEAARFAQLSEKMGDTETAARWRKLQKAVRNLKPRTPCVNRQAA